MQPGIYPRYAVTADTKLGTNIQLKVLTIMLHFKLRTSLLLPLAHDDHLSKCNICLSHIHQGGKKIKDSRHRPMQQNPRIMQRTT